MKLIEMFDEFDEPTFGSVAEQCRALVSKMRHLKTYVEREKDAFNNQHPNQVLRIANTLGTIILLPQSKAGIPHDVLDKAQKVTDRLEKLNMRMKKLGEKANGMRMALMAEEPEIVRSLKQEFGKSFEKLRDNTYMFRTNRVISGPTLRPFMDGRDYFQKTADRFYINNPVMLLDRKVLDEIKSVLRIKR